MGREQMQLQRQAAAARAASGGSSGDDEITGGSLSAGQNRLLGQYNDAIEGLNNVLNGLVPGTTEAQRLAAADRRDAFVSERDSIIRSLAGVPFGSSGAPAAQLDFDAQ
jgi:hypothetical protein